jgi:hypothetical protein
MAKPPEAPPPVKEIPQPSPNPPLPDDPAAAQPSPSQPAPPGNPAPLLAGDPPAEAASQPEAKPEALVARKARARGFWNGSLVEPGEVIYAPPGTKASWLEPEA